MTKFTGYGIAILATLIALFVRLQLQGMLGSTVPYLLFISSVLVTALYGGVGPAILATFLGAGATTYFFILPFATPGSGLRTIAQISVFILVCLVNIYLVERNRQAQLAFVKSEARFRRLVESNLIGIAFANFEGQLSEANQAFLSLVGYTESELVAGQLTWDSITAPEYQVQGKQFFSQLYALGACAPHELELIRKDNLPVPVLIGAARLEDDLQQSICFVLDMSERKQVEEALRFLTEASSVLASSLDEQLALERLARLTVPYFADWCSVHLKERDGIRPIIFMHLDPAQQQLAVELNQKYPPTPNALGGVAKVLRTGLPELLSRVEDQHLIQMANDPTHLSLLRSLGLASYLSVPLLVRGEVVGAFSFATSLQTNRTYGPVDLAFAQDLSRRAAASLDNARLYQEAQQANQIKDEFLAVVSHELRTPLNAILGWTQLLRRGKLKGDAPGRALEVIERNARSQNQLIEDLLDVSRIVAGKLKLDIRPVGLVSVLAAALDVVRLAAQAKSLELETHFAPTGLVLGDANRLQQVFWNLLSNAVKFTPNGGKVTLRLFQSTFHATVIVHDTGGGIAEDLLPHIFERFLQGNSSIGRSYNGLGLGLAIVRNLVELHGGTISVKNQDLGALFTVNLPLAGPYIPEDAP